MTLPLPNDVAGLAALAICESLLLAIRDHKLLPEKEINGILLDAAASHEVDEDAKDAVLHAAVVTATASIRLGTPTRRQR